MCAREQRAKKGLGLCQKTIIELQAELQNVSRQEDCKCEQVDILRQQLEERHIETQNARENLAIKIAGREEDAKIIHNLEGQLAQKQSSLIKEVKHHESTKNHLDDTKVMFTGGNHTKLPSSIWRRRGRSLREVFACSCFFATTDLSQIYNRETRRHGTPCIKTTDSYLFLFLYNDPREIRREMTVGKIFPNNGRR